MIFRLEEYPEMDQCPCVEHLRQFPENLARFSQMIDYAISDSINEGCSDVEFSPLPFHCIASVLIPTIKVVFRPFLNMLGTNDGKYLMINKINNE